jgi:hypothetical protein
MSEFFHAVEVCRMTPSGAGYRQMCSGPGGTDGRVNRILIHGVGVKVPVSLPKRNRAAIALRHVPGRLLRNAMLSPSSNTMLTFNRFLSKPIPGNQSMSADWEPLRETGKLIEVDE